MIREARRTADPVGDAARLYDEGIKAARAGEWEKARAALLESFALSPDARKAANLGRVEWMTCRPREAAEHLSFFLRTAPDVSAQDRRRTEDMLAKAKAKLGAVTIRVSVDGAEVLVDGRSIGTSPLAGAVFVEPGSRRIEARKAGLKAASEGIMVAAGSAPEVDLTLVNDVAPVIPMAPRVEASPEAGGGRSKALMYTGIGVSAGLAAAAVGLGIGAATNKAASQRQLDDVGGREACNRSQACADRYTELQERYAGLGNAAIYTGIGAALMGAGTAVYALTGSSKATGPRRSVMVTPRGAGASLTVTW